jgi:hypothetical protein
VTAIVRPPRFPAFSSGRARPERLVAAWLLPESSFPREQLVARTRQPVAYGLREVVQHCKTGDLAGFARISCPSLAYHLGAVLDLAILGC